MHTLKNEFYDRLDEFEANYEWNEHNDGSATLGLIGDLFERMTSAHHASIAMAALAEIAGYSDVLEWDWTRIARTRIAADWRKALSDVSPEALFGGPFLFDRIHDLHAFAFYGILPGWNPAYWTDPVDPRQIELHKRREAQTTVAEWVEDVCKEIDDLEDLLPASRLKAGLFEACLQTRTAARARLAFDKGEPLTVAELAELSGVSIKRLQNAIYAKTDEAPIVGRNGRISTDSARAWLDGRDYRPSLWQQVEKLQPLHSTWGEDIRYDSEPETAPLADYIYIPVANDGSEFRPDTCWRKGRVETDNGYTVGNKGSEQRIADFDAALDLLSKMETPRWRRPNTDSGNWGIVTGQSWRRVSRQSLFAADRAAEDADGKIKSQGGK